ncbi:Hypothetical protein CINCED_3A016374 [Cinara cedri]|uniref:Uncharacterized protein n=1 Tax=Cinara cedri TaxID=506608 RepID=A0A5E4MX02_9HEMI|nr:Hypothetical protein CINCED_3A016374 [Cinara cedri]
MLHVTITRISIQIICPHHYDLRPALQCGQYYLFDIMLGNSQSSRFFGQPVTLEVPVNKINKLQQSIQNNPAIVKEIIDAAANNPYAFNPSMSKSHHHHHQSSGIPGLSYHDGMTVYDPSPKKTPLPQKTMINGEEYFLTTRAGLLWDKGLNLVRNAALQVGGTLGLNNGISRNAPNLEDHLEYQNEGHEPSGSEEEEKIKPTKRKSKNKNKHEDESIQQESNEPEGSQENTEEEKTPKTKKKHREDESIQQEGNEGEGSQENTEEQKPPKTKKKHREDESIQQEGNEGEGSKENTEENITPKTKKKHTRK